ncbi:putative transcriptional regulator [Erwinia phage Pavtok]|uniref:Putative transcriptional regulator n=1 Tax=Erwinia phage Pavtok TaxID=2267655 RepID=A0A345BLV9_9CAUD|nr:putative transcriptional regulator [Erwinia phage Pavtok]AXF51430.1 putative transcriptional regulator [Erwinia phage Pavtok]
MIECPRKTCKMCGFVTIRATIPGLNVRFLPDQRGVCMGGYELKLWRVDLGWSQERAAEELGVSRKTYLGWEQRGASRLVELATRQLTLREQWPLVASQLKQISTLARQG